MAVTAQEEGQGGSTAQGRGKDKLCFLPALALASVSEVPRRAASFEERGAARHPECPPRSQKPSQGWDSEPGAGPGDPGTSRARGPCGSQEPSGAAGCSCTPAGPPHDPSQAESPAQAQWAAAPAPPQAAGCLSHSTLQGQDLGLPVWEER